MLEVVLKANNKNITFISGSSTIGANDDFVQSITVKAETPLTTLEELYVKFSNNALGETRQERLLGNSSYGYKCNIPQELIDFGANTWNWQILRRRYSYDRQSYTEIGSYLYTLTVGEGLKNANGENVTAAELQTLYLSAMDNERKSSQNATNAATSQNRAEEFAGLASTSEINAGISERNAKLSEEAALGSRNTAFEAANAASHSAKDAAEAKNAAITAKDEAVTAKTSANEAKNAAVAAKADAETAQKEAESAKADAETASNSAINSQVQAAIFAKTAQDAANYVSTTVRDVARAKSFDNYSELVNHLQTAVLDIPYAEGQPFYIIETDVPDLWVSGVSETNHPYSFSTTTQFLKDLDNNGGKLWVGKYQLSKLETAKVYLGDLQTKTDNSLQTSAKTVVGAINEVNSKAVTAGNKATAIETAKGKANGYASLNASGQVPSEQLPDLNYQRPTDERLTTDSKEIVGAINELDGRLDNIGEVIEEKVEPLVEDVDAIEQVLSQAKVQEPYWSIEAYNSRITAGGRNVLNGSKATLHRVVGNTIDGVNSTFGGIKSTGKNLLKPVDERTRRNIGANGNTEIREWDGETIVFSVDGTGYYNHQNSTQISDGNSHGLKVNEDGTVTFKTGSVSGFALDAPCEGGKEYTLSVGYSSANLRLGLVWYDADGQRISSVTHILDNAISISKTAPEGAKWVACVIANTQVTAWQAITVGNFQLEVGSTPTAYEPYKESTLSFPKTELPSGSSIDFDRQVIVNANGTETPFTDEQKAVGNQYTVWQGGTENVLGNDGAMLTLSQSYTIVNEIGLGGGSSSGGGTGSGGISQSKVQSIADSYATTRANAALSTAKAYTDEKIGDIETALMAILGV